MCWEKQTARYLWVKEYYTKEKDFKLQCREQSCKAIITYAMVSSKFKEHIRDTHEDVYEHQENKEKNKDWNYFRLTREKNGECILCDTDENKFSPDDLSKHVQSHSKQEKTLRHYNIEDWSWKYLKQVGDFSAKCKLCETESVKLKLNINYLDSHSKMHKKQHQIIQSRNKYSWKYKTEMHYFLNKCYTKPVNFQTKCRFGKHIFIYVTTGSLKNHIKNHTFICNAEQSKEMPITNNNWLYFRFTKQQVKEEIECIICENTLRDEESHRIEYQMKNHIEKHSEEDLIPYQFRNWIFKYAKEEEEDIVKCTICEGSINIIIKITALTKHMLKEHEKDINRIKQEEIFWNSKTKEYSWLQKCYTDVEDFRAECKFCECKKVYIKNKQFEEHVKKAHSYIHFLERYMRQFELYQDQWKCIRYTDQIDIFEIKTECMICQEIVSHCSPQFHLIHSLQELKSYSHHWALKYAKQNGDVAKCTICKKDVNFDCDMDNLMDHMSSVHPEEWKRIQKDSEKETAHDQAGPSTSHAS